MLVQSRYFRLLEIPIVAAKNLEIFYVVKNQNLGKRQ